MLMDMSTETKGEFWKGKRALVTGAAGFIGSHLVEELVGAGASVRAFVRYTSRGDVGMLEDLEGAVFDEVEIFYGDLRDKSAVEKALEDVDVVFHLGAVISIPYSYLNPEEVVHVNVMGTLSVLQSALKFKIPRVVHVSTSEVYGTAQYRSMKTIPRGASPPTPPRKSELTSWRGAFISPMDFRSE